MANSERKEPIGAWSGTRAELQRLLNVIDEVLKPVREPERDQLVTRDRTRLEMLEGWMETPQAWLDENPSGSGDEAIRNGYQKSLVSSQEMIDGQRVLAELEMQRFEHEWGTRLVVDDKLGTDVETAYDVSGLAERIDPRTVKTVEIVSPSGVGNDYRISISQEFSGPVLRVRGPDRAFTQMALARVREELKRGRPWWHWLTNDGRTFAVSGTVFTAAALIALMTSVEWDGISVSLGALMIGFGAAGILMPILRKLLPAFEIREDNGRARNASALAAIMWILALVLSIPIGLLVNGWSAAAGS